MKRLTRRVDGSVVFPSELVGVTITPDNEYMYALLQHLAAYEDTGLEPKEVTDFDRLIKLYLEAGLDKQFVLACIEATKAGMTVDRLRELAQADREGISPCTFCRFNPPSSGDGKPCCMCPVEAALRREQDGVDRWKSTPRNEEGEQRVT